MAATRAMLGVVREMAAAMEEHRKHLTKLDSEIGDGDNGNNVHRGFQAALERLEGTDPPTSADALKATSMALVGKVGGAAGPLYGTAFLKASTALSGKEDLSPEDVAEAIEAALAGVRQRGKAEEGDKTMVDALTPAAEAAREAASAGSDVGEVFRAAAEAANGGAEATVPLVAGRGRASYIGERAMGHMDPGAPRRTCSSTPPPGLSGRRQVVGIVLVSHSPEIARGTARLVRDMAGEVLVSMDTGSAALSAETVLALLEPEVARKERRVDAPFVEGAFAAGVLASTGADAGECVEAALEARMESKLYNEE